MGMTNVKKVLLVLVVVWVATLSYIWLPSIIPDFLHLRGKPSAKKDGKPVDGVERIFSVEKTDNSSQAAVVKPQDKAVHVVIVSEESRLGGMVALINSIITNTDSLVFFHLVTNTATRQHLQSWLMKSKLRSINYEIKEFPVDWVASKILFRGTREELANPLNYARYYLPRLFPHLEGRVLYLDDDCIVQGDVEQLYRMKLKPGTLAAFGEDCHGMNKRITFRQNVYADFFDVKNKHFKELNIQPTACSFNTGVFLTDLSDWRRYNITQQLEYWLQLNAKEEVFGNERGGGGAQPPMMLVFYNKYTPIDQMWHVHFLGWTARSSYSRQFIHSAKLLHWNGRFKPWGRTSPFQEIWDRYYLQDPTGVFHPVRKGGLV